MKVTNDMKKMLINKGLQNGVNMKRYILLFVLTLTLLIPLDMMADIYGTLKGKVKDGETGEPLIGATVFIKSLGKGTKTKADGSFILNNLNAGNFELTVSYTGYQPYVANISISADQTTTIDAELNTKATKTGELVVTGKLLQRESGKDKKINNDKMLATGGNIAAAIVQIAGVQSTGQNYTIRGGRGDATSVRINGVDVSNPFSNGMGPGGIAYSPTPSLYATQEVQVKKGNFSAEYGNATDGVVNHILRTGALDKYDGTLAYSTDLDFLNGSTPFGVQVIDEGYRKIYKTGGDGYQVVGSKPHNLDFSVSGYIPGAFFKKLKTTFIVNTKYYTEAHPNSSGLKINDPWGNKLYELPDEGSWVKHLTPALTFYPINDIKVTINGTWHALNYQTASQTWLYANDEGIVFEQDANGNFNYVTDPNSTQLYRDPVTNQFVKVKTNGVPERVAKNAYWNLNNSNAAVTINHTLSNTAFYELRMGFAINDDYRSKLAPGASTTPDFISGFDLLLPEDNYKSNENNDGLILGNDWVPDQHTDVTALQYTADGFIKAVRPIVNPLTGYYEGEPRSTGTANPYGQKNWFMTHGNAVGFQFRNALTLDFEGKFTKNYIYKEFDHTFKAGAAVKAYTMHFHSNGAPYLGDAAVNDIYSERWGGNIYTYDSVAKARTEKPNKPIELAGFVEDMIRYKGIEINAGLRFDYYIPNAKYRLYDPNNPFFIPINADEKYFADAENKFKISPRVSINYPVTETSEISISYGIYYQFPTKNILYDGFSYRRLTQSGQLLGNPNLDAQRLNKYEVNFSQVFAEVFVFRTNVFYFDQYNQTGVAFFKAVPSTYYEYQVNEYGNTRGVEFELSKDATAEDHTRMDLSYTINWIRGTSDGSISNAGAALDPYTGVQAFPLSAYPLGRDIRHRIKGTLSFLWGNNDGPTIVGIQPLENFTASFVTQWRSGTPYTRTDINGNALGERNAERQPNYFGLNLNLRKSFSLKDAFGDSFKNIYVDIFLNINNVLNRRVIVGFFSATGDPIDEGSYLIRDIGYFDAIAYYKEANVANPLTISTLQYDEFGNRFYNENADFNKDGMVTREENFQSWLNYIEFTKQGLGNYQYPRTVEGGIVIRF